MNDTPLPPELDVELSDPIVLADLVAVFHKATELTGDPLRAGYLLSHQPLRAFGGQTVVDLVRQGRAGDVIAYLDSFQAGAAG